MTIAVEGVGTVAEHSDSITPAFPVGDPTEGRLAVLQIVSGHPDEGVDEIIPFMPPGWEPAGSLSGGAGTFGLDDGPRRLTWFVRELDGTEQDPTTFIPSGGTGSMIAGAIVTLSRTAGTVWRWLFSLGADTTDGTGFSIAGAEELHFATNDLCLLGYAINGDGAALSAEAVTATGVTFGTVTEQVDAAVISGHDARIGAATVPVTSGITDPAAPTVDATLAVAGSGIGGVLRIREDAQTTLTAIEQTAFPPRVRLSISGMLVEQIAELIVHREVAGERETVRSLGGLDVADVDAVVRVDGEEPFGVPVIYVAEYVDIQGTRYEQTTAAVTVEVGGTIVSDAILGTGLQVHIRSWPDKLSDRQHSRFVIGGRTVIVASGDLQQPQSTLVLRTDTNTEREQLLDLLRRATSGIVLIRQQGLFDDIDAYLFVISVVRSKLGRSRADQPMRFWSLDVQEVEPWPPNLEAQGFTLQDIADTIPGTLQDLHDQFDPGTLLDVAIFDWGA